MYFGAGTLALLALLAAPSARAQRPFELDDMFRIDRVASAAISPDGAQVAVVTERWTTASYLAYGGTLWLVSTRDGRKRRVPSAELSQDRPLWSPDGSSLLYMARTGKQTQLRLLRMPGDRPASALSVCAETESIAGLAWSPDGTRLAAMCDQPIGKTETPTIIVASQSLLYGGKALPFNHRRLVIYDIASAKAREVAKNDAFLASDGSLVWREPRTLWIFATPGVDYAGMDFVDGRVIHRLDIGTGALSALPQTFSGAHVVLPSPDDRGFMLPIGGSVGINDWKQTWKLLPLQMRRIDEDGNVVSDSASLDLYLRRESRFYWTSSPDYAEGGVVYFNWFDRASNRIKAYFPGTQRWSDVTPAGTNITTFSVTPDGRKMAVVQGDANTPTDVYLIDLEHPASQSARLTHFGDAVRELYAVSPIEHLQWRSADDRFDVEGWLLKPADYVPGKRYPMILDVHGGPGVAYGNDFDTIHYEGGHEVPPELYAAKGYLVLMVNPRGDPGYGRAYQEALLEGWEYATRHDLFSGVDEVVRRGEADPERLGIAGASYGGWVTAFAVTQTDRFKAASANDPVIDAGISSAVAYRGPHPSNFWMHSGFAGGLLLDAPFPTADPRKVHTPILLRFGLAGGFGGDEMYPSQFFVSGLQYFTYLHTHCQPVEMILHTKEGHGVFDWKTLRDYIGRDLDWFDYWLKGEGEAPVKPRTCVDGMATESL
jgi:acylaminoacyl-peptidase